MLRHSRCTRTSVYHNVYEQGAEMVTGIQILVCLGDFGQIPGPSSVLFWRAAGAGAGAAFLCHYYLLRT